MSQEPSQRDLFDFTRPRSGDAWYCVNDGVMGGVSEGRFYLSPVQTLVFMGNLSLEQNGGFTSIRSTPRELGLRPQDILIVRVRGDGRLYSFNLYVPSPHTAFSYRTDLPTLADAWMEIRSPLSTFEPTQFGRKVPEMGPLEPAQVVALGFLLADKRPGPFRLEIEAIVATLEE